MINKVFILLLLSSFALAVPMKKVEKAPKNLNLENIMIDFKAKENSPIFIKKLKAKVMAMGAESVPTLLEVMKNNKISDQKRWMATFSLGRIMGKKSIPLLSKYTRHPNWMMRLASLKTMAALDAKDRGAEYADALKDSSMIVRMQALENIRHFKLKQHSADVWRMIFHKHNYTGDKGTRKRTKIISKIFRTLGDLKFDKVQSTLAKLIQKEKYRDIARDIDYALEKLSGKKSPNKSLLEKRKFWRLASI